MINVFRDLKRDIARKLEKLERKTQKAIVELICELQLMVAATSNSAIPCPLPPSR